MSRELNVSYNGASANLYAIIRLKSAGTVWNGTSLATWVNASIGDYDIPMTDAGGDAYYADIPASLSAGTYRIFYYERAGATPALTDLLLKSEELYWNGTTVSEAPSDDDLTDLATVKLYMGITGTAEDAKLAPLITAASRAVEQYCDREFLQTDRVEYYDGRDSWRYGYLSLDQCPIIKLTRIATSPLCVLTVTNASTTISAPQVRVDSTSLILTWYDADGAAQTSTLTLASYGTVTLLAAAINAVGSSWAATVSAGYSTWPVALITRPQGALNAADGAEIVSYAEGMSFNRVVSDDCVATVYGSFPAGYRTVEVRYTSGYATIPDAVQQAVCAVVSAMYHTATADPTLKSETIGDYSYTNADGGGFSLIIPDDAKALLMKYKRVRML
jgi:hypothetical protein